MLTMSLYNNGNDIEVDVDNTKENENHENNSNENVDQHDDVDVQKEEDNANKPEDVDIEKEENINKNSNKNVDKSTTFKFEKNCIIMGITAEIVLVIIVYVLAKMNLIRVKYSQLGLGIMGILAILLLHGGTCFLTNLLQIPTEVIITVLTISFFLSTLSYVRST